MFSFTAVIYGILAAGAAFLLESLFLTGMSLNIVAFLMGAFLEEGAKLLFLFQWQKRFLASVPPALPYRLFLFSLFGIGFAIIEISLASPPNINILLSLTGVHTLTSLLLGYILMRKSSSLSPLLLGLILALCLHAGYNLMVDSLQ